MKYSHFEAFQPWCPVCHQGSPDTPNPCPLNIGFRDIHDSETLTQGVLLCSNPDCQHEFPVIDGIPIIVPNLREYISAHESTILARTDLTNDLLTLIGDCLGSGTGFDSNRQHLSSYAWAHYGDLTTESDNQTTPDDLLQLQPDGGNLMSLFRQSLQASSSPLSGYGIDMGCSVGRTTFEIAQQTNELTLGIDLNFSMLRFAQQVLSNGKISFPKRRVGLVYDELSIETEFENRDKVDFWVCSATQIPIVQPLFSTIFSCNLLDAIASPYEHLQCISKMLLPEGQAFVICPYDWSSAVTQESSWAGGHSQRSQKRGSSEIAVRELIGHLNKTNGLTIENELESVPWKVRLHDRSLVQYDCHALVLRKQH